MFSKKSEFNFKAIKNLDCYIIRKYRLFEIFSKYQMIAQHLKQIVLYKYRMNIRKPIRAHKDETESGLQYRRRNAGGNMSYGQLSGVGSSREIEEQEDEDN